MADILVVDDDADVRDLLKLLLEMAGHRVTIAENGQRGLEARRARLVDLVLLDLEMPGLDGPGMAYAILVEDAGKERIPILVQSGAVEAEAIAWRIGTPYFLEKPTSVDRLLGQVGVALSERLYPVPTHGRLVE